MAEQNRIEYIDWYRNRIVYINQLREKLTNTRIEDSSSKQSLDNTLDYESNR